MIRKDDCSIIHISFSPEFEFEGVKFLMHRYCGPMFINKDGSDCKRPTKRHWAAFDKWVELNPKDAK